LNIKQHGLESLFNNRKLAIPALEPLAHHSIPVLQQLNESRSDGLLLGREHLQVIVDASLRVDSAIGDSAYGFFLCLFEETD
jgi:hypothetical protein